MSYSIFLEKDVIKFLSKLDKITAKRILDKIEILKENSVPHDAKRIINAPKNTFRIRIGIYRVLYRIENNELIVVFIVDKRSKVYEY